MGNHQKDQAANKTHYEPNEKHMLKAIELSRKASIVEKTGGVFGCVIVDKNGNVLSEGYNQVIKQNDPTWHAEMHAIREACKKVGSPHLEGCILYTSAECCPMCLSAAYWAHISHIFYGARMVDAEKYGDFQDVDILTEIRKDPKDRRIKFTEFKRPEAVEVWKEFSQIADRARY